MAAARSKTLAGGGNRLKHPTTFSCFALAAVVFLVGTPLCAGATQYDKQITGSGTNYGKIRTTDGDQIIYTFKTNDVVIVSNKNGVQQGYSDFEIDNLHLTAKTVGNPDNLYLLYGVQLNQDDQTLRLNGTTNISVISTSHAPWTYGISLDRDNQRLLLKDSVAIHATTNLTSSKAQAYGIYGSRSNQEIDAQNVQIDASAQADQYAYSYGIYDQGDARNQSRFDDVHVIVKAGTRKNNSEVITVGIYPGSSTMEGGTFTIDTLSQAQTDSGEVYSSGIYANARTVMNLQEGNIRATAIGFTNQKIQSFGIYSFGNQQITIGRADIHAITQTENNDDGWNVGASGIFAQNESAISILGGSITAELKSDGEWSRAVGVFAENSTIELGSEHQPMMIEANASAGDGYGVEARGHSTIAFYGGKIHGSSFGIQLADSSSMTLTGVSEITADPAKDGYGISLPEVNTKLTLTEGSMVHTNSLASNGQIALAKNALLSIDKLASKNENGQWNLGSGSTLLLGDQKHQGDYFNPIYLGSMNAQQATVSFAETVDPYILKKLEGSDAVFVLTTAKANSIQIKADKSTNLTVHGNSTDSNNYLTVQDFADALGGSVTNGEVGHLEANTVTGDEGNILPAFRCTVLDHNQVVCSSGTNSKLDALGSLTALSALQWRQELDDLTLRLGEVRLDPGKVGSWVRVNGSQLEYGKQNLTAKNSAIQVGSDVDVGTGWKVGAALRYSDGSATYAKGDADTDSYGVSVYGTWLGENGNYVDLVAKYSRLSTDFRLNGMDGSFKNHAYTVSAEYGWNVALNSFAFVEPQAQLTYGRIVGEDFSTGNGVTVRQDNFDSLIGRLGIRAGFHLPEQAGTVYARASVLHDFLGDMDATATNGVATSPIHEDLGGTWLAFSVGANFQLGKQAYTYVDLQRTAGGEVQDNWRWNLGLRYVW